MNQHAGSRRTFLAALAASMPLGAAGPALTATQVVEKIQAAVGVPWRTETVDKIVAGSPEVAVQGIATTMMATLEVCQRAAAAGKNFVITHEPTYYTHLDRFAGMEKDPAFQFKDEFLRKNKMAVFRFHDHWHARRPDGIQTGMLRDLGWEKHLDPNNSRRLNFPGLKLSSFAKEIEAKLQIRTMRVVGDPDLIVNTVAANWGYGSFEGGLRSMAQPNVDVLIVGECREWELVEYAQDLIASGQKKALIVLGHVVSEQAGMKYCAEWLKDVVPGLPIEFIAAAEPFWHPDKPFAIKRP
ncbi:Nif3-like dinuclear metal center hexameric protein [Bryobacter aggregatus]|uniref:Nif3-like dinuclear metal center hexameric protein n=1 Tax=Bryobacter aggregatus TaxID=360054 RepID=UPI0005690135|nr:Nif3-like dinuclear metal center hexameric protein [Bryobacter aggregatus]